MRKLVLLAGILLAMVSCEKNDNSNTAEKIRGSWKVEDMVRKTTLGSRTPTEWHESKDGDSMHFAADYTFWTRLNGSLRTGTWELMQQGSRLCMKTGSGALTIMNIPSITPASMQLYSSERTANGFVETTISLSR